MCGIAGIIGTDASQKCLDSMLQKQQHRGPDYMGSWKDSNTFLGHNRLSIIDLSANSNQPFESNCGNYVLVFNGEIYNYIELKKELSFYNFKTSSDSEVLLASYIKWGKDCLHKFNGMFSFAIWHKNDQTLFAARDRFGVKPFYYHHSQNTLYFASEIKAIHAAGIPRNPNETVWASYFTYGSYGMPNETFWNQIEQLPGGHYLEHKNNQLVISKWYFFKEEVKKHQQKIISFEEAKSIYKTLLLDSISIRFRADVSVGFNISGGLDSSTLLAFVNQLEKGKNIKAYTFYTDDERYDELPWVEEMIGLTKNPLNKVLLSPKDKLREKVEFIAQHQDEPCGGIPTVAYSQIFKQARKQNSLVLLDGQGMDEQWAGYDYYTQNNNNTIQGISKSPFRPNVLESTFLKKAVKPNYPNFFKDDVLNKQYRDLFYTKIPRALRFNDRVSMAYSTELREPFLDYRLVEFAFAQPIEYKIKNGVQKYLLRELVSEFLSDKITYAPKRPLQTPQREWLGEELLDDVENAVYKLKNSNIATWFNFSELDKEVDKYREGDKDSSFHIWQWLNTSILN
ncbi:asparagine synthase (glutamine-hydrolyzing) [Wenyingzhuangia sp. chi5]|uniref:asparagine synthase (glutamine-hydrolyzing) n=1 Tax=Wenyingzhuangia gilva TaxID=3057677 RepID=A0ABT8VT31_9FLAO|nr:asparagine synthase (glutamine-hydrolyzing) [Wenyingzhuangia sp. chi5]MDO3695128.1 asparagine synthase (glutamine-hydrolyzing) [Wenyingzhuangia sp. chi5]